MPGNVGRADTITIAAATVAGIREKSLTWAGEPIDVTSEEDGGIRQLLDVYGQQQLSLSVSGVFKDDTTIRDICLDPTASGEVTDLVYTFADGTSITGNVLLVGYDEGAPYNDATTFSVTIEYTGDWVLNAAP